MDVAGAAKFRRDVDVVFPAASRLREQFLRVSAAVHIRRIEEVDARFHRALQAPYRLFVVLLTPASADGPCAKADFADPQSGISQLTIIHSVPLRYFKWHSMRSNAPAESLMADAFAYC